MKHFLTKLFVFSIPFAVILSSYFILDPFKVLRQYDDYSGHSATILNRDYISTEMFLKNREKCRYDSYIFGSSRANAFRTSEWRKYLPESSKPFVFTAFAETIDGIHAKMKLIDELKGHIANALVIIDTEDTFRALSSGHIFLKHYRLTNSSSISFHQAFVTAYFSNFFYIRYIDYRLFHTFRPYMKNYLLDNALIKIDPITNDFYLVEQEMEHKTDPYGYYLKRKDAFYQRDTELMSQLDRIISDDYIKILKDIHSIFKKHRTHFKIIVSPLYDQINLNIYDIYKLYQIFGEKNVFNYSGKNRYTGNINNYYENSHYTTELGNEILKSIYTK